jgi:hypothetical protein
MICDVIYDMLWYVIWDVIYNIWYMILRGRWCDTVYVGYMKWSMMWYVIWDVIYNIRYMICGRWCDTVYVDIWYDLWCDICCGMWYEIWYIIYDTWYVVGDVIRYMFDIWYDLWCDICCGMWYIIYDTWYMVGDVIRYMLIWYDVCDIWYVGGMWWDVIYNIRYGIWYYGMVGDTIYVVIYAIWCLMLYMMIYMAAECDVSVRALRRSQTADVSVGPLLHNKLRTNRPRNQCVKQKSERCWTAVIIELTTRSRVIQKLAVTPIVKKYTFCEIGSFTFLFTEAVTGSCPESDETKSSAVTQFL